MILAATILVQGFITMAGTIFISAGRWRAMLAGSVGMLAVLVPRHIGWLFFRPSAGERPARRGLDPLRRTGDDGRMAAGRAWRGLGFFTDDLPADVPSVHAVLPAVGRRVTAGLGPTISPAALAALGMGIIVFVVREILTSYAAPPPVVLLLVEVGAGVAAYTLFARREIRWCLEQLRRF